MPSLYFYMYIYFTLFDVIPWRMPYSIYYWCCYNSNSVGKKIFFAKKDRKWNTPNLILSPLYSSPLIYLLFHNTNLKLKSNYVRILNRYNQQSFYRFIWNFYWMDQSNYRICWDLKGLYQYTHNGLTFNLNVELFEEYYYLTVAGESRAPAGYVSSLFSI